MTDQATFEARLTEWVAGVNKFLADHAEKSYPASFARGQYTQIELQRGVKYIRVIARDPGQGSAFCFLDLDGNILKPDGWKRPARGIRGSIFDDNFSIGRGITPYGAAYIR